MAVVKSKPRIVFSAISMQKMKSFCLAGYRDKCEVSMLGVVASADTLKELNDRKEESADFWVLDFFPVKQEGHGAYTEMDPEAVILLRQEMVEKGYPNESQIVHFHTHPGMSTTPSSVDETQIEAYDPDVALITVIMNENYPLRGDRKGINVRLDIWTPFRRTFKDGEVDFKVEEVSLLPESWGEDTYAEFVVRRKPPVTKVNLKGWTTQGGNYFSKGYSKTYNKGATYQTSKPPSPYMTLSNEELQEAYDEGSITEKQARKLEFRFQNDPSYGEDDLLEDLYDELYEELLPTSMTGKYRD